MHAIIPHVRSRSHSYAWGCISVNPDPPRVGEVTRITFPLLNPGPDDQTIERIDVKVAQFGIGVQWEQLPAIGPLALPAQPGRVVEAAVEWTPTVGGHRCVRAQIYVAGQAEPCTVGCNLHVIEAGAEERTWSVPFRLGNPERERAPIHFQIGGNNLVMVEATVRVDGRVVPLDQPVWLAPGEEVEAELLLRAKRAGALNHVRTVEAWVHGHLIDGIQVTVHRPAVATIGADDLPAQPFHEDAAVREPVAAFAR
jgi:hypothetical protein